MSNDAFAISEPFEPTALDEQTELRTLARALEFAQGFKLLFARCNQRDQRLRIVNALRKRIPQFTVQEIHFDEPIDHLLDALRERLVQPPPDVVFVSGLEYSLPTAADAHETPFVASLNAARNSFPQILPCPLVLWMPEYVLAAIMRGAPDFFSIRSGVYYFAATPRETAAFAESLTAGEEWQAANLTFAEKQERIGAIENLIADYYALPSAHRNNRAEAHLLKRLGNLYWTLGGWTKAERCYQQSLKFYRQFDDRAGEGRLLNNLGEVYRRQRRWEEAEQCHRQSLKIKRDVGDRIGEGIALGNLGSIYSGQKQWAKAEQWGGESGGELSG
ncbi:MAG: tetratricopeptide repeat protein, partial [Candidatus Poribacteria bacterium]|nr:tetratricopeptide repeat protein [Candidatus Poribacteria bacterium]